ncbi:MAG TPA: serine/threonine-protein kinase, partial [Candidatus Dormibacteraeota bacterium]|nr:serine/threonine-protein kinase [Candidatus Dormibacteraeota bacterium]
MKDLTGTRLGQYEIVERLGGGGMAVVYRAVQQPLGREVALKALSPELFEDDGFVKRFEAEAKTLARLDHPNILTIYDFEMNEGVAFLTMPLIRGGTLRDILRRGPLDTLTAWRYLREIGDGLQHAHDAGIVHRDLKPTNVLIHSDGRALLADFGLARGAGQPTHLTTIGLAIGTPGYMAPEQVMGHEVDRRADIYAMGVLTFEMLTGRLPYVGANRMEVAYATVNSPIPSACALNANLPDELDQLLTKVLAKDPNARPQTVRELLGQMAKLPQRRASAAATVPPAPAAAASSAVRAAAAASVVAPPPATPSAQPALPGAGAAVGAAPAQTLPPIRRVAAPVLHGSPPPTPSSGSGSSSAVRTLELMGIKPSRARGKFILNSFMANMVHVARDVTHERWNELAYTAGFAQYLDHDPPDDDQLATPVDYLSRLNEAFEVVYGAEAEDTIRAWGRRATERWLADGNHGLPTGRRLLMPGRQRKLASVVKAFCEQMDNVRGEHTHAWLQVDEDQFWMVNFSNMFALGRIKTVKSCHVWIATIEAILRWAGLANDWYVEEVECGSVTGTFDCVFA